MRSVKLILVSLLIFAASILMVADLSFADDGSDLPVDGLYSAVTEDNVTLKMRRYRPDENAEFREGGQPILVMPGLFNSFNEFIIVTPEDRKEYYTDIELDDPLAEWAVGDEYIEEDHMRYYSLAHYLWLKGYDPWFGNYRGLGRGEFESDMGSAMTNLDVWSALDVPAFVDTIYEETGMYPVIGGHSTGGLVAYSYLQGVYFDVEEFGDDYIPHVKCDPLLAQQRNSRIKGFLGIDPASVFPMSKIYHDIIDNYFFWYAMGAPFYIDLDYIMGSIVDELVEESDPIIIGTQTVIGAISYLHDYYPEYLPAEFNLFEYLDCWRIEKTHPYVVDFIARHSVSSSYMRVIGQYFDALVHNTLREHYKNGEENRDVLRGPNPDPGGDGYYYYSENMDRMSVPAYLLLSDNDSLVGEEQAVDFILNKKTADANDDWFVVPGSAHVDLPFGLYSPTVSFPRIGEWLDKICPDTATQAVDDSISTTGDDGDDTRIEDESENSILFAGGEGDDSVFGCGSSAGASMKHAGDRPILPGMLSILIMMLLPFVVIYLRKAAGQR